MKNTMTEYNDTVLSAHLSFCMHLNFYFYITPFFHIISLKFGILWKFLSQDETLLNLSCHKIGQYTLCSNTLELILYPTYVKVYIQYMEFIKYIIYIQLNKINIIYAIWTGNDIIHLRVIKYQ